jgi:putative ABC transport system permease protein
MRTSLAVRNLTHSKVRTLVAIGGVCFAVTLLFMQLGFFATMSKIAMLVYDSLDFDIVLTSPNYVVLTQAGSFSHANLYEARAHPGVERVMPLYAMRQVWQNPVTRIRRAIEILGVNPSDLVSRRPDLERLVPALGRPDTVLIDRLSRAELGPQETGVVAQVGARNLKIIGQFTIGPGFEAGLVIVGDQTFSRLVGGRPLDTVNVGLIKLKPGADPAQVVDDLQRRLPADVRVLTRSELAAKEAHYWVVNTAMGVIFGCGVLVAVLFGVVITYQVLSLEVSNRLSEYATLKALGFTDAYLSGIVLKQAVIFAVVSFIPGFFIALAIYYVGGSMTNLPIAMTVWRVTGVFILNLVLCCFSGLLALRILRRADPVDLF